MDIISEVKTETKALSDIKEAFDASSDNHALARLEHELKAQRKEAIERIHGHFRKDLAFE